MGLNRALLEAGTLVEAVATLGLPDPSPLNAPRALAAARCTEPGR